MTTCRIYAFRHFVTITRTEVLYECTIDYKYKKWSEIHKNQQKGYLLIFISHRHYLELIITTYIDFQLEPSLCLGRRVLRYLIKTFEYFDKFIMYKSHAILHCTAIRGGIKDACTEEITLIPRVTLFGNSSKHWKLKCQLIFWITCHFWNYEVYLNLRKRRSNDSVCKLRHKFWRHSKEGILDGNL